MMPRSMHEENEQRVRVIIGSVAKIYEAFVLGFGMAGRLAIASSQWMCSLAG